MNEQDIAFYERRHQMIQLPCVRVQTRKAGGSGTVIYCKGNGGDEPNEYSTYILTNHHVIAGCIDLKDRWSPLLKKMRKVDVFEIVDSHFFTYKYKSRSIGGYTIQSDIVAYDPDEDLALLRLRAPGKAPSVAELFPRGKESELRIGMKVICVGAALGEEPVQTEGVLSQFGQEYERKEYWLDTAPSIYGNSGGALFLKNTYQLVGVPAMIGVQVSGFSIDPITHLSYCIPITRIYNFLDEQRFRFIFDDSFTEAGEEAERGRLREEAERKIALSG